MAGFLWGFHTADAIGQPWRQTKEARIARSFAKANSLYGVKFVCYLDEKWVFRITNEPGLVVDPAYPPKYIIVTEEGEVRFSTPEEGNNVYQLTNVL